LLEALIARVGSVGILESQPHRECEAAYVREVGYDRLLVKVVANQG
jgi:hypothetical protein